MTTIVFSKLTRQPLNVFKATNRANATGKIYMELIFLPQTFFQLNMQINEDSVIKY